MAGHRVWGVNVFAKLGLVAGLLFGATGCTMALTSEETPAVEHADAVASPQRAPEAEIEASVTELAQVPWRQETDRAGGGFLTLANILLNGLEEPDGAQNVPAFEAPPAQQYANRLEAEFPTLEEQLVAFTFDTRQRRAEAERLHDVVVASFVEVPGGPQTGEGNGGEAGISLQVLSSVRRALVSLEAQMPVLRQVAQDFVKRGSRGLAIDPSAEVRELEVAFDQLRTLEERLSLQAGA